MELWEVNSSCGVSVVQPSREKEVFSCGEHWGWFAVAVLI